MFEIDKQKFGAFVAQLRKEKGFTQKDLAQRLFISDKAVSKWETGASIPDTALLVPLADLLGVSVTELLMCQQMERGNTMNAGQVERIVKKAISYSGEEQLRVYGVKSKWSLFYGGSLIAGGIGLALTYLWGRVSGPVVTAFLLAAFFGAYFCFFVKMRLPAYYDENRIGAVQDGIFRMNVPGLYFNNSNWPHIVKAGRIWACLSMALMPAIAAGMAYFFRELWRAVELHVTLVLLLGGLFIPIYAVGKKYE